MAILITGASAGFGAAMCRTFVAAGYHVIGAARREDKLQQLAEELGEQFYPLEMDVSRTESIQNALNSLPEHLSEIDCLKTNIIGLTFLTRQILPQMVARKQGYIINLGSIAGSYAYSGSNVYGATKAFVRQFSMNLRAELADKNIRITNIEPGLCGDTEFSNVRFKGDDQRAAEVYENVEFIQPQDIADTALWLYQRPARMNVNSIEIMPVAQTFAGMKVYRDAPAPAKEETFEKQSMSLFGKIKSWFK